MFGDSQWSNLRSALIGAVVAAVVLVTFPAAAAVGSSLILGEGNSADAVTSLSGSATTNLRITNTRTGSPALTLRVEEGAAPLAVNSLRRVRYLNADRLDGKHGAAYALADEQPKAASCSASVIADGRDWACPMTIEVPATGSVLLSGSVDFYNNSGSADVVWCGFYLDDDPEPTTVHDVTIQPHAFGTCASDLRVAAGAGTYTLEFRLSGVGTNTAIDQGGSWMLFVAS